MTNIITPTTNLVNIPQELKDIRQWVLWKYKLKTKVPINPHNLKFASSTNPSTWGGFEETSSKISDIYGLGFVFTKEKNIVGIDLDHVFEREQTAKYTEEILKRFKNTYIEKSPSGAGYHIYAMGVKKTKLCKNTQLDFEYYDKLRFFTVTGNKYKFSSSNITNCQSALNWFEKTFFKPVLKPKNYFNPTPTPTIDEQKILSKAFEASNGSKIERLYKGDISNYSSHSEADLALLNYLSFYTQDLGVLDSLMRSSGLMRKKWNRLDYKKNTINKALQNLTKTYQPSELSPFNYPKNGGLKKIEKYFNIINSKRFFTRYDLIDKLTKGLRLQNLYIVSGLEKSGKSSWLMNMLVEKIKRKENKILFVNTELTYGEFFSRMTSYELEISEEKVSKSEVINYYKKNKDNFVFVGVDDFFEAANKSEDYLQKMIQDLISKFNIDCLILDNLTSLMTNFGAQKGWERGQKLFHQINTLTKKNKIISFVVIHAIRSGMTINSTKRVTKKMLSNHVEYYKEVTKNRSYVRRPNVSDVYGGNLVSQASGVIFIWRPFQDQDYKEDSKLANICLLSFRYSSKSSFMIEDYSLDENTGKFFIDTKRIEMNIEVELKR